MGRYRSLYSYRLELPRTVTNAFARLCEVVSVMKNEFQNDIKFNFSNGWTASIIASAHGLNSCMAIPRVRGKLKSIVGPQEAFDDELPAWIAEIAAMPEIK